MDRALFSGEEFTQAGFLRWLAKLPASALGKHELIGGRIVVTPPAGWEHGGVDATLARLIGNHAVAKGLGIVLGSSTGYELPSGDTLQPDVSFISRERFAAGPKPLPGQFLRIVPTLIVEILSPSTARRDRTVKLEIYARNGVDEYWIVDPIDRELEIRHREGDSFATPVVARSGAIDSRVLLGIAARVEDVFADLD